VLKFTLIKPIYPPPKKIFLTCPKFFLLLGALLGGARLLGALFVRRGARLLGALFVRRGARLLVALFVRRGARLLVALRFVLSGVFTGAFSRVFRGTLCRAHSRACRTLMSGTFRRHGVSLFSFYNKLI